MMMDVSLGARSKEVSVKDDTVDGSQNPLHQLLHMVDGRNPKQLPGMYNTLETMG